MDKVISELVVDTESCEPPSMIYPLLKRCTILETLNLKPSS